ncbi:hypothetical protein C0995_009724, partial [Termitomyces sp. Mi166
MESLPEFEEINIAAQMEENMGVDRGSYLWGRGVALSLNEVPVSGSQLEEEQMSQEKLEIYGLDWEGITDDHLLESLDDNNPRDEPSESWFRRGPPPHLNE